ncbi:uncharacterized protein EAE98_010575 [Botrytis deweyae]|uniref:RING-type domain-containing protein n=1 Tax=Botrytis deweyae TaxID=2478750 RepID=A0ABQ7I841_9HELO|nr:uncharacterized protein EAE98_010575 [Botrytis deweyae]KAF7916566.1 hypothetical protein EAE98_010575 [Botrytis deweyae]
MCLTLTLNHFGCVHEESYVRPCGRDGIRCNMMSVHTCYLRAEVCRDCWMLPDFRQAPSYQPEEAMTENDVLRYQDWNLVAETQDLQARLHSLPLPNLLNQYAHFYSTKTVVFDLLNQSALGVLDEIVHHHLVPAFQARIIDGENVPLADRIQTLNIRQILVLNYALADASQTLDDDDWRIAMGYRVFTNFNNSTHFTRLEDLQAVMDDCGICRNPLNHHDEGEINRAVVKTICNHMFHEGCLERWFVSSARGDCPMCRKLLRETELPQIPTRLEIDGPFPEWLTILNRCIRPVIPRPEATTPPDMVRLQLAFVDAREALVTAREEFTLADRSVRTATEAIDTRVFVPLEDLRTFQDRLFESAANIEEQDFRDYQYSLRQHQRTRLIRENALRDLLHKRQEKDHAYDLAQSRYYAAARALKMAWDVVTARVLEEVEEAEGAEDSDGSDAGERAIERRMMNNLSIH